MKRNIFKLFLFVFTFIAVVSCENQNDEILMSQEDELFMTYDQESPESVVEYLNEKFAHLNGQFYTTDQFIAAGFTPAPSSVRKNAVPIKDFVSSLEALSSSEEYFGAAQGDDPNDDGYNGVLLAHWDPWTFCGEACNGGSPSGLNDYLLQMITVPNAGFGRFMGRLRINWFNNPSSPVVESASSYVSGGRYSTLKKVWDYDPQWDAAHVVGYNRNSQTVTVEVTHVGSLNVAVDPIMGLYFRDRLYYNGYRNFSKNN